MAQIGGHEAAAGPSKVLHDPSLSIPQSCTGRKHNPKSKVPKHTKAGTQRSTADSHNGLNPAIGCRYDSSLGKLRIKKRKKKSLGVVPLLLSNFAHTLKHSLCYRHSFGMCW